MSFPKMVITFLVLFLFSVSCEENLGWFAVTTGNHALYVNQEHESLFLEEDVHVKITYIKDTSSRKKTKSKLIHTFTDYKDLVDHNNLSNLHKSKYKVYEFLNIPKEEAFYMIHGPGSDLHSNVLFFEKNKRIYALGNTWVNSRWGGFRTLDANCRYATGGGHAGFQTGAFSWGIDVLDTRDANQDLVYCPANGLKGTGVHVFVMDTGIGSQTTMNFSRVHRDFDYYYDAVAYNGRPYADDGEGHGSHVSGLVASSVYGAAPEVELHIYKVLDDQGYGSYASLAAGLTTVYTSGIQNGVITMSLGVYGGSSSSISTLMSNLMNQKNMVFTVAAGNDGKDACNNFPSNVPGTVSVGSFSVTMRKSDFSNYGSCVSIFAPGQDIISCAKTGTSAIILSGTSMATPIVAGVVALIIQNYGNSPHDQETVVGQLISYGTPNLLSYINTGSPNKVAYIGSLSSGGTGGGGGTGSPHPPSIGNAHSIKTCLLLIFMVILMIFLQ
jgi:subtilisin family serine protease